MFNLILVLVVGRFYFKLIGGKLNLGVYVFFVSVEINMWNSYILLSDLIGKYNIFVDIIEYVDGNN